MNGPQAATAAVRSRYLGLGPDPGARLRLFCFHHAGGAASAFSGWQRDLGPRVSVLPVQLPGREGRIREPGFADIAALTEELSRELGPLLREPYAFYGHSMGAIVAYCLTQHQHRNALRLPEALLVGAYPAPHLPPPLDSVRGLPDDRFAQWLVGIGGMSPTLLDYPAWVRSAVELARTDLDLCHSYVHAETGHGPLPCPIHAFTGSADPLMADQLAQAWEQHTLAGCELHVVPGGHFFIAASRAAFLNTLADVLAGLHIPDGAHEGRSNP